MLMMRAIQHSILLAAVMLLAITAGRSQTPDIRNVVEAKLKDTRPKGGLSARCPIYDNWVAARVFTEYGAIYLAEKPVVVPSKCIVESGAELSAMQAFMNARTAKIGGVTVTLQEPALNALLEARAAAAKAGIAISPRGGSIASTRSYEDTVRLWNSRFEPAIAYWVRKGRIKKADADALRDDMIRKQIEAVLTWEQQGIWFSKDLKKSILYSVAIPGASQHNFMLAIDIEQFQNARVRQILADHGWFQTVKSDLPHFTYLGLKETDLATNGLTSVTVGGQKFWIPNVGEVK
jgi:hypothetical protein